MKSYNDYPKISIRLKHYSAIYSFNLKLSLLVSWFLDCFNQPINCNTMNMYNNSMKVYFNEFIFHKFSKNFYHLTLKYRTTRGSLKQSLKSILQVSRKETLGGLLQTHKLVYRIYIYMFMYTE